MKIRKTDGGLEIFIHLDIKVSVCSSEVRGAWSSNTHNRCIWNPLRCCTICIRHQILSWADYNYSTLTFWHNPSWICFGLCELPFSRTYFKFDQVKPSKFLSRLFDFLSESLIRLIQVPNHARTSASDRNCRWIIIDTEVVAIYYYPLPTSGWSVSNGRVCDCWRTIAEWDLRVGKGESWPLQRTQFVSESTLIKSPGCRTNKRLQPA